MTLIRDTQTLRVARLPRNTLHTCVRSSKDYPQGDPLNMAPSKSSPPRGSYHRSSRPVGVTAGTIGLAETIADDGRVAVANLLALDPAPVDGEPDNVQRSWLLLTPGKPHRQFVSPFLVTGTTGHRPPADKL